MWFRKAPRAAARPRPEHQAVLPSRSTACGAGTASTGSRGFVQYQFVVPYGAEASCASCSSGSARPRTPSFLAVLKRFEHDSRRMLGFPIDGWTLALDIPRREPQLARAARRARRAGRATPAAACTSRRTHALRPELLGRDVSRSSTSGATTRAALDPQRVLRSDMDRRLDLTGDGRTRS